MKELINHIREFNNELGGDLEAESHHGNNAAWKAFNKAHPYLILWVSKLFEMADKAGRQPWASNRLKTQGNSQSGQS